MKKIHTCLSILIALIGSISVASAQNREFNVNGVKFTMVAVEGGCFTMGSTTEQDAHAKWNEEPLHQVTLSSYYIGQTEVTQELWQAVMGSNPSENKGETLPVERVSWDDCQEFIKKLNRLTGEKFRLPTEAEWEYAARGGSKSKGYKYSGSDNLEEVAWVVSNSSRIPHQVATKVANELGIYDMLGNVMEWCGDFWCEYEEDSQVNPTGSTYGRFRVVRGGCCYEDEEFCRVSVRADFSPDITCSELGFRLVL